jgi:uncharacterized repeat protein (TIGR02543 family)
MKKTVFFALLAIIPVSGFISCTSVAGPPRYSIVFHLEGGHIDGHPGSVIQYIEHGNSIDSEEQECPAVPQKENYVFGGWFTAKNGFGNKFTEQTRIYTNLTVYAKWINNQ